MLAVLLAATAALVALSVLRPAPAATQPVLVASRNLATGERLGSDDVQVRRWPREMAAELDSVRAGEVPGRVTAGPVRAGEVISAGRLASSTGVPSAPGGSSALTVPSSDETMLALVRTGDRVDVYAADGRRAGSSLLVIGRRAAQGEASALGSGSATPGALTVAVTDAQMPALARALRGGSSGTSEVVVTVASRR